MYHLSVFLHVLAAMIWVGGIIFLAVVAVPVSRRLDPVSRSKVVAGLGRQFRIVGWSMLGVLLLTGIVAAASRGATVANVLDGTFWATPFGRTLGEKLVLVLMMAIVSFTHDFIVGPAAARAAEAGRDTSRLRRRAAWLARLTALFAILIVFLAINLPRPGFLH